MSPVSFFSIASLFPATLHQATMAPKERLKDLGTFTDLLDLVKRATSGKRKLAARSRPAPAASRLALPTRR